MDTASVSVLKLFGSEAEMRAADLALSSVGIDGLRHPVTERYEHMNPDEYFASRFERYTRGLAATIAGGTSEIQRNIIAQQVLGLPRGPEARLTTNRHRRRCQRRMRRTHCG